jgi:hypothetical protein
VSPALATPQSPALDSGPVTPFGTARDLSSLRQESADGAADGTRTSECHYREHRALRRARLGVHLASNHRAVLIAFWYAYRYAELEGGLLVVARSFEIHGDESGRWLRATLLLAENALIAGHFETRCRLWCLSLESHTLSPYCEPSQHRTSG